MYASLLTHQKHDWWGVSHQNAQRGVAAVVTFVTVRRLALPNDTAECCLVSVEQHVWPWLPSLVGLCQYPG